MPNKSTKSQPRIKEVKPGDVFYTPESPQCYEAVEVVIEYSGEYNSLMYVPRLDGWGFPSMSNEYNVCYDSVLERLILGPEGRTLS